MAKSLIELRTDLKSLRYQGTNGSNPPYVTKDINNPPSSSRTSLEIRSRIDDVIRVGKAMLPTNSRFVENQLRLNAFNTEKSTLSLRRFDVSSVRQVVSKALEVGKEVGKVTLSTLAQTGVAGTGTRIGLGFKPTNSTAALTGQVLPNNSSFEIKDRLDETQKKSNLSKETTLAETEYIGAFGTTDSIKSTKSENGLTAVSGSQVLPNNSSFEIKDRLDGTQNRSNLSKETGLAETKYIDAFGRLANDQSTNSSEGEKVKNQSTNSKPQPRSELKSSKLAEQNKTSNLSKETGLAKTEYIDAFGNTDFTESTKSENGLTAVLKGQVVPGSDSFEIKDRLDETQKKSNLSKETTLAETEYIDAFGNKVFTESTKSENGQIAKQGSKPVYEALAKEGTLKDKTSPNSSKLAPATEQKSQGRGNYDKETGKQSNSVLITYQKQDRKYNKILKTRLGEQGLPNKPSDYRKIVQDSIDQLNAAGVGEQVSDDLIKFYFKVITPDLEQFLTFRAYLTDFSDTYQGNWSDTQYIGRADKLLNYTGFSRDISLSFTIAASTRAEMKPLYSKIVYLASTTAPTYGGTDQNFMRGTLVELTVGDYLANTPGVITSVSYKWQQNYPWEIVLKEDETDVQQLPMVLDCSINFRPIHNFIPQTGLYPYITDTTSSSKFWETSIPEVLPETVQTVPSSSQPSIGLGQQRVDPLNIPLQI